MRRDPFDYLATELDTLKQQGLYRHLRILEGEQKSKATVDHHNVVNLSSNNYLGLTTHPKLREAALEATRRLGVGSGSVRSIAGTMDIHMELERRLADFKKTEAVVVFQSGFAANAGTVAAVFSMDGDLGALPGLCALAEEYGCIMMVDDAHASGVFGANGRGTIDHFGMHGRVDIQVGTLSKAFGVLGGYVAGSRTLIDFLYHRARPFLFSTSHPPGVAAECIAAIDVLIEEPELIERLWENTRFFQAELK